MEDTEAPRQILMLRGALPSGTNAIFYDQEMAVVVSHLLTDAQAAVILDFAVLVM